MISKSVFVARSYGRPKGGERLNIFATSKARAFLCEADILVTDVRALFFSSDDFATAARLKDIEGRLADEIKAVERLIAASTPAFRH